VGGLLLLSGGCHKNVIKHCLLAHFVVETKELYGD